MDNGESSYRRFLAGDNEGTLEIVCEYQTGQMLYSFREIGLQIDRNVTTISREI